MCTYSAGSGPVLKSPDIGVWQRTSPFAILFFLGRIVRLITKNAWQSFAPLFALLVAYQGDLVNKLTVGGIVFGFFIVTASVLSYWFFRFQLSDDAILIRQGVLKKKQLDIKFDRIQGINIQQNVVYRFLGLVTVNFDTAGSAGSEGNLPAVTRPFADALRARIGVLQTSDVIDETDDQQTSKALLQLDWRDMIRIGLADRRALIVLAFVGPLFERLGDDAEDIIGDYISSATDSAFQFGIASGVMIVAALAVGMILLLAAISIAAAFLRYHNFALFLDGSTLRSHGGLLTRHEHSMDLGKIQTLRLQQGIVQRWLNRYHFAARQAISSGKHGSKKIFTIPVVTAELADQFRRLFLGPEGGRLSQDPRSQTIIAVSPHYMRSGILFIGLLPALFAVTAFWFAMGPFSLLFFLWPVLLAWIVYRSWRRAGYVHDDDEIIRRSGLLGYRTAALLFRKVQRVSVTQSRYQRRKNLASLRLYMASGSVRIPYIDHETAKRLRDYVLYKVEASQLAWH